MTARNYKVSGKKLEKSFYAQPPTQRLAELAFLRRVQQSTRSLSLDQPSHRRGKKAAKKFLAGGFDTNKRIGRFEHQVLGEYVRDEMRYDRSY